MPRGGCGTHDEAARGGVGASDIHMQTAYVAGFAWPTRALIVPGLPGRLAVRAVILFRFSCSFFRGLLLLLLFRCLLVASPKWVR